MMYVIFNNDGSTKVKFLNEFVEQGNAYENILLVCFEGRSPSDYYIYATFKLPNGDSNVVQSGLTTGTITYRGVTYTGKYISLTPAQTLLTGYLQMNVVLLNIQTEQELVSFDTYITVNSTDVEPSDPIIITRAEYENLLRQTGSSDYSTLTNKPSINNVQLTGNKTSSDLGLLAPSDVKNDLVSTDTDKPLSANMGKTLNEEIGKLKSIGKFLSLWNGTTGKAVSEPETTITYHTGDYFRVSVAGSKIPTGSTYDPQAQNWTTGTCEVGDVFYFDGSVWLKQEASGGITDFDELSNRPKYNGYAMTHETNIPAVKTAIWDAKQNAITNENKLPYSLISGTPDLAHYILDNVNGKITANSTISPVFTYKSADNGSSFIGFENNALADYQLGVIGVNNNKRPFFNNGTTDEEIITHTTISNYLTGYQLKLTAGSNITINQQTNTISATYNDATTSAHGLMSVNDKIKLNGITSGATNVYVSASGGSTTEAKYITVNGAEYKIAGGSQITFVDWS